MQRRLTCADMIHLLDDYVDLKLSDDMDVEIRDHIIECEQCYRRWKVRLTVDDLHRIMSPKPDPVRRNAETA